MKTPFPFAGVVLAGLLILTACGQMRAMPRPAGPPPGGPNDPVPTEYLRGTEFDYPTMTPYSWGIMYSPPPNDGGVQVQYSWSEVRRRLAARR
jgi:hypothetical protein